MNPKEIAEEWERLAHSHGRALCWRFMDYWYSIQPTDPYYAVYQETLKRMYKTEWGSEWRKIRGV